MLNEASDRRLAVIGCTGAGKSTLAERIADEMGVGHIQLDDLYHGPNWTPRPHDVFRKDVAEVSTKQSWVIDGNYRVVRDLIWPRATTVIWLDYSLPTCFSRLLRRTWRRASTGESICNGNRESFRMSFASRDSILLYQLRAYRRQRRETSEDLAKPEFAHLRVIPCRHPRDADAVTLR